MDSCPNALCGRQFKNSKAVISHLNQPKSSCFSYFSDADRPAILNLPAVSPNQYPVPVVNPEDTDMFSDDFTPANSSHNPESSNTAPVPLTEYHPTSSYILDRDGKNILQRMEDDQYAYRRLHNHFYPFKDRNEWELGRFLCCSSLKQGEIDDFLKLSWVSYYTIGNNFFNTNKISIYSRLVKWGYLLNHTMPSSQ